MSDFSKFAQMLANGGTFEGKTYLSPTTFEMMTKDYAGKDSGVARDYFYFPGDGFGMIRHSSSVRSRLRRISANSPKSRSVFAPIRSTTGWTRCPNLRPGSD